MPILLVDQNRAEADALAGIIERSGSRVTVVSSLDEVTVEDVAGFEGTALGAQGRFEDRIERCQKLRDTGYAGAVLAVCADVSEGETMLDAGADDFVAIPFEALELVTRMRASVRRATGRSSIRWGPLELDRVHRVLRLRGRSLELTARECELLVCLIQAAGRVVSRASLRERVAQGKGDRGSNVVEVHLCRLRDKLGDDAAMIETVRRGGYRLRR